MACLLSLPHVLPTQARPQEQVPKKKYEQISGEAGHLFLLSLVRKFWEYAKDMLYPDIILSDPEEREVLNLIWESVYGKFRLKASEKEWLKFHESAITRVDMVAKWLTRRSIHWIPKPHLYFHPHSDRNGFKKTWEWYLRQETLKLEIRNKLNMNLACTIRAKVYSKINRVYSYSESMKKD